MELVPGAPVRLVVHGELKAILLGEIGHDVDVEGVRVGVGQGGASADLPRAWDWHVLAVGVLLPLGSHHRES